MGRCRRWRKVGAHRFRLRNRLVERRLLLPESGQDLYAAAGQEAQALWNIHSISEASLSPDGQWVAFYSEDGNRNVPYIGSVNDPSAKFQISKDGGHHPLWSRDGTRLYYAADSTGPATALIAVDVRTKPSVSFGEPAVVVKQILQALNQPRNYDITPDGRLVAAVPDPQRSTRSGEIIVVLNGAEELKRRVPIE